MASQQDSRDSSIMELREVNRMMYLRPDNGSLVDKRTHKEYNFSNLSYNTGSDAQAIIQSGADAVWGPTSYLKMAVTLSVPVVVPAAARNFDIDAGSLGLNMIESVRLTHRSGEIIEFIDKYNMLGAALLNWGNDVSEVLKLESQLNAGTTSGGVSAQKRWTLAGAETSKEFDVIIPMWLLLGCFDNKEQYIPPNFLAGAKLELKIASAETIFSGLPVGGDPVVRGTMTIRPSLVLDSAKVYDSVAAQILDQQADVDRSGLQFTYSTWFNNSTNTTTNQINVDVQQSASITEKVIAVLRDGDNVNNPFGKDSFKSLSTLTDYQWRLGSTYYPQARVNLKSDQSEAFQQTLIAWDSAPNQYLGFKSDGNCSISLRDFNSGDYSIPHYATTLEKSAVGLTLTGEPTNNARSLNLSATLGANPGSVDVQVFLKYTRIANIMGENLVVDR